MCLGGICAYVDLLYALQALATHAASRPKRGGLYYGRYPTILLMLFKMDAHLLLLLNLSSRQLRLMIVRHTLR